MKILQVIPYFYPAWTYGGPVRVAYDVSRGLAKKGHEVTVYTSDMKNCCTRIDSRAREVDGIEVHYFRNLSAMIANEMKLFITPEIIPMIKRKIRSFDVAHLHEYRTFQNIAVHHYATKYGVPYVLQAHGSLPRIMAKQRLKWIYDVFFGYRFLKDASKVIALCQMEAEQYMSMGVSEEKIRVIPNGIDLSKYADLSPKGSFKMRFNIPEDKKIILYLGRIHKTKGIGFLVRAYAHLIKNMKYNDATLVIAGPDDGYLTEGKRLLTCLEVGDKAVFTGMLSEKEKLSAYVDSSIVVNVEPRNVFGLVPLEAATCSTPVVVSKGNAISETICEGNFGSSVKYGEVNELAEIMGKMLRNDDLLTEMGQNGRKFIYANCNWANIVTKLEKVYKEAVAGAK